MVSRIEYKDIKMFIRLPPPTLPKSIEYILQTSRHTNRFVYNKSIDNKLFYPRISRCGLSTSSTNNAMDAVNVEDVMPPTARQLVLHSLTSAVPMIGKVK